MLRLPPELSRGLAPIAKKQYRSIASLVNEAVHDYLKAHRLIP